MAAARKTCTDAGGSSGRGASVGGNGSEETVAAAGGGRGGGDVCGEGGHRAGEARREGLAEVGPKRDEASEVGVGVGWEDLPEAAAVSEEVDCV